MTLERTVLCIPGPWESSSELISTLIQADTGFLFAGRILMEMESSQGWKAELDPRDERMDCAFRSAGSHWAALPEMQAIEGHRSVVYLIDEGGSRERAEALMRPASALIRAGGLGVKVESTGVAHSPAQWLELSADITAFTVFRAYVITVTGAEPYSCGMHNFGMRDVRVVALVPDAAALVSAFTWYLFLERPTIRAGQTFSVSADAPRYRIVEGEPVDYGPGSLFTNEFGTWQLEPVEG